MEIRAKHLLLFKPFQAVYHLINNQLGSWADGPAVILHCRGTTGPDPDPDPDPGLVRQNRVYPIQRASPGLGTRSVQTYSTVETSTTAACSSRRLLALPLNVKADERPLESCHCISGSELCKVPEDL